MNRLRCIPLADPNPTPDKLVDAPELAVFAILEHTLRIAGLALLAAQPAILGEPPAWRLTPDVLAAKRVLRRVRHLENAIDRYQQLVRQSVDEDDADDDHTPDGDDDLLF